MPRPELLLPPRRLNRWKRVPQVVYRDTKALLREFHRPILTFLFATIGGGLLYNELLIQTGHISIPLINIPYTMIMLMAFQAPSSPPSEPQLIVFWYVMPVIALYVLGRGTADFARLFFDRSGRRNAWEEAVATTYRNHVIILGIGHLGTRISRTLVQMGFDVVAIDKNIAPESDALLNELNVPMVVGDGRMPSTLETAGLRHAQALIVCTSNDLMNLEITMRARDLNPTVRIVVRMWDNQFAKQIQHFMNVEAVMSATDLAAPVFAGSAVGIEIAQTLHINGTDYSMIRLQVEKGSFLASTTIDLIQRLYGMDIVLHEHDSQVEVHPKHENMIHAGDTLVVFAQHSKITDLVARNRKQ